MYVMYVDHPDGKRYYWNGGTGIYFESAWVTNINQAKRLTLEDAQHMSAVSGCKYMKV
jgi:hypothetical protein